MPLFLGGAVLAYFVMDKGLSLLLGFAPDGRDPAAHDQRVPQLRARHADHLRVSFELPLLLVFLNLIGVLRFRTVAKHQRMVIFLHVRVRRGGRPRARTRSRMLSLALPMVGLFVRRRGVHVLPRPQARRRRRPTRHLALEEELDGPAASRVDDLEGSARD